MAVKKIGAVSYLNTAPLIYGMSQMAPEYQVVLDLPSRLAERLAAGELDVALIPSIEVAHHPDYRIVSDACIGCRGPVWSVKLLSRVPLSEIRTMALDEGSKTSIALAKIILAEKYGVRPEFSSLGIREDFRQTGTDAVLIIGDRAMKFQYDGFSSALDLGQVWYDWTGLPFVFAVWAARPGADLTRLASVLSRSRNMGVANAIKIASQQSNHYGLTVEQCRKYLTYHLQYYLRDLEKRGMQSFYERAAQLSLVPASSRIQYHDLQVA